MASFVAAGVTGATGVAAISRTTKRNELPLAAIPLFFAAQQAVEGALWLTLPVAPEGAVSSTLTYLFLLFAKVFWPLFVPLAVLLIEPDRIRRWMLIVLCAAGAGVALFFAVSMLTDNHSAHILGGHVVYSPETHLTDAIRLTYLLTTCIAPIASSHRAVQLLGLIVTAGALVTFVFYWDAFASVWCFFAAAGSVVILTHFVKEHRAQQQAA